jgi:predicted nucleic acid-binding Zn ribbon protein
MSDRRLNPLSQILDQALRKLDLADAALEARAVILWPQIVGPQMAAASEARSVRGGVLAVIARNSAWNQEIAFQKPLILRRFRERLGESFVKDLRCSVGAVRGVVEPPASRTPPEEEVRRIQLPQSELDRIREASRTGDPELAQAIRRALTHEAQLRHWQLAHGARACPRCGAAFRTPQDLCPACRQDDSTG